MKQVRVHGNTYNTIYFFLEMDVFDAQFQKEVKDINDEELLGDTIEINSYPLHKTPSNCLLPGIHLQ